MNGAEMDAIVGAAFILGFMTNTVMRLAVWVVGKAVAGRF